MAHESFQSGEGVGTEASPSVLMRPVRKPGLPRTFESFKNRNYRLYWASMMGQMGAMNMQLLARSWLRVRVDRLSGLARPGRPVLLGPSFLPSSGWIKAARPLTFLWHLCFA